MSDSLISESTREVASWSLFRASACTTALNLREEGKSSNAEEDGEDDASEDSPDEFVGGGEWDTVVAGDTAASLAGVVDGRGGCRGPGCRGPSCGAQA